MGRAARCGLRSEELNRRGAKRVGIIGVLTWLHARQLGDFELVGLGTDYSWLRMRKSDEEIDWMRIGAAFSDLGLEALLRDGRTGMTERELGALVERDYHALGGATVIHFIGRNNMANPDLVRSTTAPLDPATRRCRHDVCRVAVALFQIHRVRCCAPSQLARSRPHCFSASMTLPRRRSMR